MFNGAVVLEHGDVQIKVMRWFGFMTSDDTIIIVIPWRRFLDSYLRCMVLRYNLIIDPARTGAHQRSSRRHKIGCSAAMLQMGNHTVISHLAALLIMLELV
jgi:hypothetical protein